MFKEAGLRSPRTQLTKVKIAIIVQGRRTEASCVQEFLIPTRLTGATLREKWVISAK